MGCYHSMIRRITYLNRVLDVEKLRPQARARKSFPKFYPQVLPSRLQLLTEDGRELKMIHRHAREFGEEGGRRKGEREGEGEFVGEGELVMGEEREKKRLKWEREREEGTNKG